MLSAVAATLHITKQKKVFKGAFMHHGALEGQIIACPMKALLRLVAHISVSTSNGDTSLCILGQCWQGQCQGYAYDILYKFVAAKIVYPSRKIPLYKIDTH